MSRSALCHDEWFAVARCLVQTTRHFDFRRTTNPVSQYEGTITVRIGQGENGVIYSTWLKYGGYVNMWKVSEEGRRKGGDVVRAGVHNNRHAKDVFLLQKPQQSDRKVF